MSNNLIQLDSASFTYMPNMSTLEFSFNQIEKIEPNFFENFPNFEGLFFYNNECVSWSWSSMESETDFERSFKENFERCFNNWTGNSATSLKLVHIMLYFSILIVVLLKI